MKLTSQVSDSELVPFYTNPFSAKHFVSRKMAKPVVAWMGATIILGGDGGGFWIPKII